MSEGNILDKLSEAVSFQIWFCPKNNFFWLRCRNEEGTSWYYPHPFFIGKERAINPYIYDDIFVGEL